MKQGIKSEHWSDQDGNPAGGCTYGVGFSISWQNGPLGRGEERKEPNGAFVGDVLDAVRNRLEFYQSGKFNCEQNRLVLSHINQAMVTLQHRTIDRESRQVEGTHQV